MTPLLVLVLVVLGGGVLAVVSAVVGLVVGATGRSFRNGPWFTNTAVGSQTANPYVRAAVAIGGLLALPSSETVYAAARRDSDGDRLRGDRTYRIVGEAPDAYWWSITVYGADGYLIPEVDRWSYSVDELSADPEGVHTITLSSTPHEDAWIPLRAEGRFTLALRLYLPGPSLLGNEFRQATLPRIEKGV